MDLGPREALVKACLCLFFLFGLLQWRVKMGFKARLEAMQSHSQKRRRQRLSIPEIGLLSLCAPDGLASHASDGWRISLESKFYSQKESLTRFTSSSSALHRTSLFPKVSSSKLKFTHNEASVHDAHRLAHPVSQAHDAHPSWRDTEGSWLNDASPEDSGWHLVSRRHSLKTPQPSMMGTLDTLTTVRHPHESAVTAADASKIVQPCATGMARPLQPPVYPVAGTADAGTTPKLMSLHHQSGTLCESTVDAFRILQPCMAHTLHPPESVAAAAADAGTAHKLVALRHHPSSPCESAAAAADALVSLHVSTTPAVAVDVAPNAHVSLHEAATPHEAFARTETMSAAYSAPQALYSMARTGHTPVMAPLLALAGSNKDGDVCQSKPTYKLLLEKGHSRDTLLKDLHSKIAATTSCLEALQLTRKEGFSTKKKVAFEQEELPTAAAFSPLSKEEEEEVHEALYGANRHQVLVQHEPSNIDLSRAALQCLKPGAWLNDEVINLYMELLKERERREQKGYLNCHFFNTFFFNKLYKDARSYDFKAVRRWTTQRKLGYSLLECDKIFVPIHKDIHWCLAVINMREKRFQYLDSLKGHDENVLQVLARYIKDEAKDKGSGDVDTSSWHLDCPKDIPEQMNGCDCGMFMIKYADFLSRGNELKFTQENMEYFRKRTALELLQLKVR